MNPCLITVNGEELVLPPPLNGKDYKLPQLYTFINGSVSGAYKNDDPCIQLVPLPKGLLLLCEDNGIALGLPMNKIATVATCMDVIQGNEGVVGDVAFIKEGMIE